MKKERGREIFHNIKVENSRVRRQVERMGINDTVDCQSIDEKSLFMACYIK